MQNFQFLTRFSDQYWHMECKFGVFRNLIRLRRCKCILLKEFLEYPCLPQTYYIWKKVEIPYFLRTLKLHFDYNLKVLALPDHRQPKRNGCLYSVNTRLNAIILQFLQVVLTPK